MNCYYLYLILLLLFVKINKLIFLYKIFEEMHYYYKNSNKFIFYYTSQLKALNILV